MKKHLQKTVQHCTVHKVNTHDSKQIFIFKKECCVPRAPANITN